MKMMFVAAILALLMSPVQSSAQPVDPYHYNGYNRYQPYGWGYYPFAWWIAYEPYFYGYNYYPYWNYNPRYETYGAIAYSADTGNVGYSWGYYSRWDALSAATNYCGDDACRGVVWVRGGCAALALDQDYGAIAYAYALRRYESQRYALRSCRASGGDNCQIGAWVCSY